MLTIMRREFNSYFSSPIGFIYLSVFYILSGFFFFSTTLIYDTADMSYLFSNLYSIIMFLIPILTMRLLSEEKKQKTDRPKTEKNYIYSSRVYRDMSYSGIRFVLYGQNVRLY